MLYNSYAWHWIFNIKICIKDRGKNRHLLIKVLEFNCMSCITKLASYSCIWLATLPLISRPSTVQKAINTATVTTDTTASTIFACCSVLLPAVKEYEYNLKQYELHVDFFYQNVIFYSKISWFLNIFFFLYIFVWKGRYEA